MTTTAIQLAFEYLAKCANGLINLPPYPHHDQDQVPNRNHGRPRVLPQVHVESLLLRRVRQLVQLQGLFWVGLLVRLVVVLVAHL
jgi:hypothetical protein